MAARLSLSERRGSVAELQNLRDRPSTPCCNKRGGRDDFSEAE
jgi:hypothetical protein